VPEGQRISLSSGPDRPNPSFVHVSYRTFSHARAFHPFLYLAVAFPQRVWDAFNSWLRTIRPGIPPSELVVANALRQSMPEFLLNSAPGNSFANFVIVEMPGNVITAL